MHQSPPARVVLFVCCALLWATGPINASRPRSPRDTVEQLIDSVRQLDHDGAVELGPKQREKDLAAKKLANQALAILDVSKQALGPQWDRLGANEQQQFVALVTELFERIAYPKSSSFFGDLTIDFGRERVSGEQATVETIVRHPKEGRVAIDYKLRRTSSRWMIYDILLDEVSLAIDLRSQIQKVLREESYPKLLQRMRDKLKE